MFKAFLHFVSQYIAIYKKHLSALDLFLYIYHCICLYTYKFLFIIFRYLYLFLSKQKLFNIALEINCFYFVRRNRSVTKINHNINKQNYTCTVSEQPADTLSENIKVILWIQNISKGFSLLRKCSYFSWLRYTTRSAYPFLIRIPVPPSSTTRYPTIQQRYYILQ